MLQRRIGNLTEVSRVDESDIILVFCPVVSRAGTDIDTALERFSGKTDSKLAVLVVLHHTFDPEKTIPDSSRSVKRTDILTVDCLFYEDRGLLKCQKNSNAVDKTVNWLIQQGRQTGVKIRPRQNFTNPGQNRDQEPERLAKVNKRQKMANNEPSTKKVKVFLILAGKIKSCHKEIFDILRKRTENLEEARTVDESDIILVFCPIVSRAGTDIDAALKNYVYPTDVHEMTCNSSRPVDYFIYVTKDTHKCDVDFIDGLHKQVQLRKVSRVQDSEIILLFCPVCSPSDISATLQEYHKRPDKPAVVIFLHKTLDSDSVPNSSGHVKSRGCFSGGLYFLL
ncbi:uncharacterized protein si:dkey-27p18.3 [Cyprinus carpio]|uniref:Uncharacterized protein si:dkey-27p18.3 n=1 Tax=Cyprinus carpio TaxID=7962 RepID=A0A9R0AWC4_CYPCA|nr:uncharacterized protein si:dkey-27p18.3 [Cyprinus carpio]